MVAVFGSPFLCEQEQEQEEEPGVPASSLQPASEAQGPPWPPPWLLHGPPQASLAVTSCWLWHCCSQVGGRAGAGAGADSLLQVLWPSLAGRPSWLTWPSCQGWQGRMRWWRGFTTSLYLARRAPSLVARSPLLATRPPWLATRLAWQATRPPSTREPSSSRPQSANQPAGDHYFTSCFRATAGLCNQRNKFYKTF